ncbi:MAG: hypothetical protein IIW01_08905 [Thermoguttaceae bacterium]|nr:hypothetical protein [Thermoguttaceae bacterium]
MSLMTSLDVLKVNNSEELVGLIEDVVAEIPEIDFFAASPVEKNSYQTLTLDGLPSTAFRETGTLREFQTGTLGTRQVACKYLDASWTLEQAVAQQSDWGEDFAKALQQRTHLKSAFYTLAKQIWRGVANDANGFVGLNAFVDKVLGEGGARSMVVRANADAAGSDGSTVYAVRTGIDSCQLAWGSKGAFDEGEVVEQLLYDRDASGETPRTSGAWHYAQKLGGWVGLQVTSKFAAGKIEGLSATSGLTDDLLYQLLERFPASMKPQGLFMSKRSWAQLRRSRTAYNPIGAPAPYVDEFEGVKIYVSDAISNAETYSAASSD